jgi:hypothetical protein
LGAHGDGADSRSFDMETIAKNSRVSTGMTVSLLRLAFEDEVGYGAWRECFS